MNKNIKREHTHEIKCPRCDAVGQVTSDGNGYFTVVWTDATGSWRDTMVRSDDLVDPYFGCGFDEVTG